MQLIKTTAFYGLLLTLSACASLSTPGQDLIDTTPVVLIGNPDTVPKNHIVHIPANTPVTVTFVLQGDLFNKNAVSNVQVSLKQDLYLYRYWASLDGRTWVNSHELLNVQPSGGFDHSGARVSVQLDLAR